MAVIRGTKDLGRDNPAYHPSGKGTYNCRWRREDRRKRVEVRAALRAAGEAAAREKREVELYQSELRKLIDLGWLPESAEETARNRARKAMGLG